MRAIWYDFCIEYVHTNVTSMTATQFNYDEAFSRNIGLVNSDEQKILQERTIAIPGMGGVGGIHLIALVRQGFQKFKIADCDTFELKNFNRQYGARLDTLGLHKAYVMKEEALKINPECVIEVFENGINEENISQFLDGVHLSVDALDAFAFEARRMFFNESLKRNIPVITAGPIGFGTAFLIFMPGGPTFDAYFATHNQQTLTEKLLSFFIGLAPQLLQRTYMQRVSIDEKRGPSSSGAVALCAGIVAITAVKILLRRGRIKAVPYYHQFDVMRNVYVVKKLYFGNYNPLQQLKIRLAKYLVKD